MQTEKEYIIGREINALRCESIGEYALPDYNTDVKKLLSIRTCAFPTGKFVGDDLLEFSGTVGYEVVYLDAENSITHTEFSTDYEAAVRISSDTYCDSDIKTSVSACNVRLIGPRKFSVKCSLDSDVRIAEKRVYAVGGDAFIEYEPEIVSGTAQVFSPVFGVGDVREISEEITSFDGVIVDEVEVLLCDVTSEIGSVDATESGAAVKGNIKASVLYKNGDDIPKSVEKVIPYSQEIAGDGFLECGALEGYVDITSAKASVNPTEEGVAIAIALSFVPKIYAKKNSEIDIVADAYLKERGSDNEYSEFAYTEHICTERSESNFVGEYHFDDGEIDKIDAIIHSDGTARVDLCEILDSAVKIAGEIKFSAIACQISEDGEYNYLPIKFALPFEHNVNINCQKHDNMRVIPNVSVRDVKMDVSENNLSVSAALFVCISLFSEKRQRCLGASYLTDEEFRRDESVVTVYYPDASESLFDIAKRFHTSAKSIAEANRLTETVFASQTSAVGGMGIKKLLIK